MEADPRFRQVRLSYETDAAAALHQGRPRARLRPRHRHHRPRRGAAGDARRQRGRRRSSSTTAATTSSSSRPTNPVNDPTDLENLFLKTRTGEWCRCRPSPRSRSARSPPSLTREQQMRAGRRSPPASADDCRARRGADATAQEIAAPLLPPGGRIVPLAEAATLGETSSGLLVDLRLRARSSSSWCSPRSSRASSAPIIVMATVPLGLGCAMFAMVLTGTSLNVYSQIGLVLLVGIIAKNGILDRRVRQPAARPRHRGARGDRGGLPHPPAAGDDDDGLRPILGGVPLVLAGGAGAEARIALGWVIVGGLGLATVLDAVPDAGRLPAARRPLQAARRGNRAGSSSELSQVGAAEPETAG